MPEETIFVPSIPSCLRCGKRSATSFSSPYVRAHSTPPAGVTDNSSRRLREPDTGLALFAGSGTADGTSGAPQGRRRA